MMVNVYPACLTIMDSDYEDGISTPHSVAVLLTSSSISRTETHSMNRPLNLYHFSPLRVIPRARK